MKILPAIAVSVVFLASFLFAEAVSLSGTVKDAGGSGIEGVNVSLAKIEGVSGVTNAEGAFTLTGTGVRKADVVNASSDIRFHFSGTRLMVSFLPVEAKGYVAVFSSSGRRVAHMQFSGTADGEIALELPQLSPGLHIMRLFTGSNTISATFLSLGKELRFSIIPGLSAGGTFVTGSAAAAVDTLLAVKAGYTDAKVAINAYTKEGIEIVMEKDEPSGPMPFVYENEFTGEDCPKPDLVDDPMSLPEIEYHPDPFLFADGKRRVSTRAEWRYRRAEIKAILEKYDAGIKPGPPDKVEASLSGNKINIICTQGSNSLTLSASIDYANGKPDSSVPAIIGVGGMMGGGHSLPDVFSSRGIATISFDPLQVHAHSGSRTSGSFYKLYPDLAASGGFIRWAWAFSRLIDALEMLPEAHIDVKRLAVSGCSYAGKIALFCGAWDERVALTLPHESGGGGTISWRYSDMLEDRDNTEVENLHHAQGVQWYAAGLKKYEPKSVSPNTLPYDHHELIGMIAPRAVLCIESSMIARMGGEAARASALGARKIWEALGVPDRMGATEENTNHCSFHNGSKPDLEAFVDRFLLGDENVATDILRSKFNVDDEKWNPWEAPELK